MNQLVVEQQQIPQIVLTAANSDKVERLLETILQEQERTNNLLEQIAQGFNQSEMLDQKQAADFLGISPNSLYNKASQGLIPRYKSGSKNLYKRSDLEALRENGRVR